MMLTWTLNALPHDLRATKYDPEWKLGHCLGITFSLSSRLDNVLP